MATFRRAKVVEVVEASDVICRARLALDDGEIVATGFPGMLGPLAPGDAVIVNMTALELDLGTGGEGFILWNLDGAAPPIVWSKLVAALKRSGLIDSTCTAGHSFGGDIEAVNIFSGMAGLVHARSADVVVAAMGPGVVGTGTVLGFTALEQGQLLDAATALGGRSVACLRISFADPRPRHTGVSHHTITALKVAAREPSVLVLPELPDAAHHGLRRELEGAGLGERHEITTADGAPGLELLSTKGVSVKSMGRSIDEIPELFLAASAAGRVAAERL